MQCPPELRNLKAWLLWSYETGSEGGKPRKVPQYASGGRRRGTQGSDADRAQLVTFDEALEAAEKRHMGLGFVLLPDHGITVIDFDNCVLHDSGVHPEVVRLCQGTYAELSPSGNGVHAFYLGNLGDRKDAHGEPFGIETFSSTGYVTFTGVLLSAETPRRLIEVSPGALDYCTERFGSAGVQRTTEYDNPLETFTQEVGLDIEGIRAGLAQLPNTLGYEAWVRVGMGVHHETDGSDDGFGAWDEWSQTSPEYTTREYGWGRWASFGKHQNARRPTTFRFVMKLVKDAGGRVEVPPLQDEEEDEEDEVVVAGGAAVVVGGGSGEPDPGGDDRLADFEVVDESVPEGGVSAPGHKADQGERSATGDKAKSTPVKKERFAVIPAAEFAKGQSPEWIVRDVLPRAALAVVYGESGAGKTFVLLDLMLAIARGVPWRGQRTTKGRVAYVAAEGAGGLRKRLRAYARHHALLLEDIDLVIVPSAPNLLLLADAQALAKAIGKADVVVIDTMAASSAGGDENAGKDMSRVLANCLTLHRATGALVILVHHAGKDLDRGARGWSGIKGGVDAELEVRWVGLVRALKVTKFKDGDLEGAWGFTLQQLDIGTDEEGDPVTSCVVMAADLPQHGGVGGDQRSHKPLGPLEALAEEVIGDLMLACERVGPDDVVAEMVDRTPRDEGKPRDSRRDRARRSLETAVEKGRISYKLHEGFFTFRRSGD